MALTASQARHTADNYDPSKLETTWHRRLITAIYTFIWNIRISSKLHGFEKTIRAYAKSGDYSVSIEKPIYWKPFRDDIVKVLEERGYTVTTSVSKRLDLDSVGVNYIYSINFFISWKG